MGSLTAVWREGVTFHREEGAEGAVMVPGWQRAFPWGAARLLRRAHTFCATQRHLCFPRRAGAPRPPAAPWRLLRQRLGWGTAAGPPAVPARMGVAASHRPITKPIVNTW